MKISKLFHWLYAILMMLPVFFIGGRMIYVTFNKNAKDSYSVGDVTQVNEVLPGQEYVFIKDANVGLKNLGRVAVHINSFSSNSSDLITKLNTYRDDIYYIYTIPSSYTFVGINENNVELFNVILQNSFYVSINLTSISYKNNLGNSPLYEITNPLDNSFIYSINQVNTNPLFSWASTSFLIEPFQYITNLFGVPSDSPINTLLSYWLDISIIYLVFDVVMYVPLLAHRWIDKGMIE